jgi:hypothetical protein
VLLLRLPRPLAGGPARGTAATALTRRIAALDGVTDEPACVDPCGVDVLDLDLLPGATT